MAVEIAPKLFKNTRVSQLYQENRPRYTDTDLMVKILTFMGKSLKAPYDKAADIGCGTGLSTQPIIPHFKEIVGLDASSSQVGEATRCFGGANTKFFVGTAEDLSRFADSSLDLLCVGTAIHYFDIDVFYKELDRILKPGGTFAQFGYNHTYFQPLNLSIDACKDHPAHAEVVKECNELFNEIFKTLLERDGYMPAVDRETYGVDPPKGYLDQERHSGALQHPSTMGSVIGMLESLGLWQNYCKLSNIDTDTLANQYRERFTTILKRISDKPEEVPIMQHFTFFTILARKPSA